MAIKHPNPAGLSRAIRDIAIRIGRSSEDIILVGGQSVLFWVEIFDIPLPKELPILTEDVDFIASMSDIVDAEDAISPVFDMKLAIASMDETSPNSGKMTIKYPDVGKVNVDFLRMITGLSVEEATKDPFPMNIDGDVIQVLSPILLLKSKISNIGYHLSKRNDEGIAQGRLAVAIARRYLELKIKEGDKMPYSLFEEIIRFSKNDVASYAYQFNGIDTMTAIPVEMLPKDDPFVVKRYPVAMNQVSIKRAKFAAMVERMSACDNDALNARFHP
ncbi:MAG: hypothetical protein Q8O64_05835 [Sideroxyarcus sp.]|nr:hypothetical protein [Sideroxyarcus sp.]